MRIVTWNMQGGATNTQHITTVVSQTHPNVLCLQECGALGVHLRAPEPLFDNQGAIIGRRGNFVVGQDFLECVCFENEWTQGGLAIMTNLTRTNEGILAPANAAYMPANPRSIPWMEVRNPTTNALMRVYSIHSPPSWDGVSVQDVCAWNNAQIGQISGLGGTWACVGDFNADPTVAEYVVPPAGAVVHGGTATHQGGSLLDYSVTNAPGYVYSNAHQLGGASDHYPQTFQC